MMEKLRHFALTSHPTVYDEEALSSLELMGRIGAKVNQAVDVINEQISIMETEIAKIEKYANDAVIGSIANGSIADTLQKLVGDKLKDLEDRIDNLVTDPGDDATSSAEIVDARKGYNETYATLGQHLRALANGNALSDAIRPGTVNAGRIMAGMFGGEMRDMYTIREIVSLAGNWGQNGYVDAETLEFVEHTGYTMSNSIRCSYGDVFLVDSNIFGPLVRPAVVYDGTGKVLQVLGEPGESDWDTTRSEIHITRSDAYSIRFVCGNTYLSTCRVYRVAMKQSPDVLAAEMARGYLHMTAKNRTDTVTDRAQIKCWFPLPANHSGLTPCRVHLQLHDVENVKAWTVRIFNAASGETYDLNAAGTAQGYEYDPAYGLDINFTAAAEITEGTPVTHISFFIDLIAADPTKYMQATLPAVTMYYDSHNRSIPIKGQSYSLHGAMNTDTLNVVDPCAASSPLYKKRVLGIGDSLMRNYTSPIHESWFNIMCGSVDAVGYNAGTNGRPIAGTDSMASNINSILQAFPQPDYVILQGGANDLRLAITEAAYRSGIQSVVAAIRAHNPRAKILMAAPWHRTDYYNDANLTESDYVEIMLEEAEALNIPCMNNYVNSLNLTDPATAAWAEGADLHFSAEANRFLAPAFRKELEGV